MQFPCVVDSYHCFFLFKSGIISLALGRAGLNAERLMVRSFIARAHALARDETRYYHLKRASQGHLKI